MEASIRSRSLVLSVLIHGALLLLLLFAVMHTYNPPFPESGGGGVLIQVGNVEAAMGDVQPLAPIVSKEPAPVKAVPSPPAVESKVATQENEQSYAMKESTKKETKKPETKAVKPVIAPVKEEKKVVEKPRVADPGALYQGKSNNSKSQGNAASGMNDQGAKDGVPDSKYYGTNGTGGTGPGEHGGPGGPGGKGMGDKNGNSPLTYDLTNRTLLVRPTIDDRSQETGKVVVAITVNKEGNVTAALPGVRGSTTTSTYLFNKAKEAAMQAKFSKDDKGNDIQKGTITFVFVVQ